MTALSIEVSKRDVSLRNPSRKSKEAGIIPGILYNKQENLPINIPRLDFVKKFNHAHSNTIFDLNLDGQKHQAFIKDYQQTLDKSERFKHVDFYLVDPSLPIKIRIPVSITGVAEGVVKGGYLEHYSWELEVECLVENIPERIEVDVTPLDIGQRLYVKDIDLGENINILEPKEKSIIGVMISSRAASQAETEETEES